MSKTSEATKRVLTNTSDWKELGFKDEKTYDAYLRRKENNPPPYIKGGRRTKAFESVFTSTGQIKSVLVTRTAEPAPVLIAGDEHQIDAKWEYPPIASDPVLDGEAISRAAFHQLEGAKPLTRFRPKQRHVSA